MANLWQICIEGCHVGDDCWPWNPTAQDTCCMSNLLALLDHWEQQRAHWRNARRAACVAAAAAAATWPGPVPPIAPFSRCCGEWCAPPAHLVGRPARPPHARNASLSFSRERRVAACRCFAAAGRPAGVRVSLALVRRVPHRRCRPPRCARCCGATPAGDEAEASAPPGCAIAQARGWGAAAA